MVFLPPYVVHESRAISAAKLKYHRVNYKELPDLLREDKLDINHAVKLDYLNDYLIKDKNKDQNLP